MTDGTSRAPVRGALERAWAAVPGDLLGRIAVGACGLSSPSRRVARGAGPDALVFEDARCARYLDRAPVRPWAQTLGRYVLARGQLDDVTLAHELEHTSQWARWGPLFIPAYLVSSLLAVTRGRNGYLDNRFERSARAVAARPQ